MAKHGTASVLSIKQFREFSSAVLRNLPDDLDPAFAQQLIEGQDELRSRLQRAFAASPTARLVKTLTITCVGDKTTSQLRQLGKYDWSNDTITNGLFPITPHEPTPRQIEILELERDWSWDQGLAVLAAHDLEQPTAEDCLYFGIHHPEEQRAHPIVFPHEPVQDPNGRAHVLVLDGDAVRRELDLRCTARQWTRRYLVVGVRAPSP